MLLVLHINSSCISRTYKYVKVFSIIFLTHLLNVYQLCESVCLTYKICKLLYVPFILAKLENREMVMANIYTVDEIEHVNQEIFK